MPAFSSDAIAAKVKALMDAGQLQQDPEASAPAPGPQRHSFLLPALADGIGNTADLVTTQMALHHPELTEGNPIMSGKPAINALEKIGGTIGEQLLLHKLNDHHPTMAKIMGLLLGGVGAGAAVHNLSMIHGLSR